MFFLLLLFQLTQNRLGEQTLKMNQVVRDTIQPSTGTVWTETLDKYYWPFPARAKVYNFSVPQNGTYHIEMRSHAFDTFLILRGSDGKVLAEDDDGWIPSQSRIQFTLKSREQYQIFACALHGNTGDFQIFFQQGEGDAATNKEIEDWKNDYREQVARLHISGQEEKNIDKAQKYFENALKIAQEKLGEMHQETAKCYFHLGRTFSRKKEFSVSAALIEKAIAIQERFLGTDDIVTCNSYLELAAIASYQGNFSKSKLLYEKAFQGYRKHIPPDEGKTALTVLEYCGLAAFWSEKWADAEKYYRKCLMIDSKLKEKDNLRTASILSMLGYCLRPQGDTVKARAYWEEAKLIYEGEERTSKADMAELLYCLGGIATAQGNYDYAKELLGKSLTLAQTIDGPNSLRTARTLANLGRVFRGENDRAQAKSFFTQSISLLKNLPSNEYSYLIGNYLELADIEVELLQLDDAKQLLRRAEEESPPNTGTNHWYRKLQLFNLLGRLYYLEGDFEKAAQNFEQALQISTKHFGDKDSTKVRVFNNLTNLYLDNGKTQQSWDFARKACAAAENNFLNVLWSLSESERYDFVVLQRLALEATLSLTNTLKTPESLEFSFDALSAWKARVFKGMMSTKKQVFQSKDKKTGEALNEIQNIQSKISGLTTLLDSKDFSIITGKIEELRKDREQLERSIENTFKVEEEATASWKTLRQALPENTCLINFIEHRLYISPIRKEGRVIENSSWSTPQISAWVLNKNSERPIQVSLGTATEIETLLRSFLTELVAQRPLPIMIENKRLKELNQETLKKIWLPLATQIQGNFVIFSADGCLGSLPFGVIQQENGRYLIEDYKFVCLQDIASIDKYAPPIIKQTKNLLAVGAIDFQNALPTLAEVSRETLILEREFRSKFKTLWTSLPETAEEVREITELHQQNFPAHRRVQLFGKDPTEERVKSELPNYSYVHIASHGFFRPEGFSSYWDELQDPKLINQDRNYFQGYLPGLLSGIVCAGANLNPQDNRENGLLTAEEISWIDLSQCDLVVLSACQTGLGTIKAGEGMIGLRSAFRQAGAKTVISSLWSIGDKSTRELMRNFYKNLWADKKSKLDALRDAQLAVIANQRKLYKGEAFPYAWGAFVLDGDWR